MTALVPDGCSAEPVGMTPPGYDQWMLIAAFVVSLTAAAIAVWSALSAHRSAHTARDTLAVQQRSFELTHRPYLAVTQTVGNEPAPGENSIGFFMMITNAGNVPGRITSNSTTYVDDTTGFTETLHPPLLKSNIVYPNETIQSWVVTQRGRRIIDHIDYEDLKRREQYWFEIEYFVPSFPPQIIRKDAT